ncbi:MAG: hypothetical protein JEZ04_06520 [Spirochaetales bacterium]|nr:hypothetical protein [Spirochaetales bacterium]
MTKEQWVKVSSRVRTVFNFGIKQTEWLENCKMARLIAAVPYLSGCDKAEETSYTHLSVYIMSIDDSAKEIYFHKPEDDEDLYSRLLPISNFKGGDEKVIQCCMNLIALNMISNYNNGADEDLAIGKYNPVAEGKWSYPELSEKIIKNIEENISSKISALYVTEDALKGLWDD